MDNLNALNFQSTSLSRGKTLYHVDLGMSMLFQSTSLSRGKTRSKPSSIASFSLSIHFPLTREDLIAIVFPPIR